MLRSFICRDEGTPKQIIKAFQNEGDDLLDKPNPKDVGVSLGNEGHRLHCYSLFITTFRL
jgi:hypothetical protein